MQGLDYWQLIVYALPGIFLGIMLGYLIGGTRSLRLIDRIGLGLVVGVIGGIIISLMLVAIVDPGDYGILLAIIANTAGIIFGEIINWAPIQKTSKKSHILFDPEEEEKEFERQLKSFMDSE